MAGALLSLAGLTAQAQESSRWADSRREAEAAEAGPPFFTVAGGVRKPGRFEIREGVTVLEALMLAGGLTDPAKIEEVLILRRKCGEDAEIIAINLKQAVRRGGRIDDAPLRPGDLVLAAENGRGKAEGFLRAMTAGRAIHSLQ
ncbi:MAG: polysaccharide biosynthesis/export family protein [Blastocatellia bacterium]